MNGVNVDKGMNDMCWNQGSFLVVKSLEPYARRMVGYPGVSNYERGTDEITTQHYYILIPLADFWQINVNVLLHFVLKVKTLSC